MTDTKNVSGSEAAFWEAYTQAVEQNRSDDDALALATRATELAPDDMNHAIVLGAVYLSRKEYGHAVQFLQQAIPRHPNSAQLQAECGLAYFMMDDFKSALPLFLRATILEPDQADWYKWLGSTYNRRGQDDEAIAILQAASRLSPDDAQIHASLAKGYTQLKLYSQASEHNQRATRLAPHDPLIWATRAVSEYLAGEHDRADASYARARKVTNGDSNRLVHYLRVCWDMAQKTGRDALFSGPRLQEFVTITAPTPERP